MVSRGGGVRVVAALFLALVTAFTLAGCGSSTSRHPVTNTSEQTATAGSQDASDSTDDETDVDASDEPPSSAPAARRYVEDVAGVRLGMDDAAVTKRFGQGLFTNQEGEAGARYYVDANHTLTLHVELMTGSTVSSMELSYGLVLPAGMVVQDDPNVVSRALDSKVTASKGIALGMSAANLIKVLGKPMRDERTGVQRVISYDDEIGESDYWAEFTFVGDHLRDIWISDAS
jgi:hypothetical protein